MKRRTIMDTIDSFLRNRLSVGIVLKWNGSKTCTFKYKGEVMDLIGFRKSIWLATPYGLVNRFIGSDKTGNGSIANPYRTINGAVSNTA